MDCPERTSTIVLSTERQVDSEHTQVLLKPHLYSRRLAALATDKAAFEASLLAELRRAIKVELEKKYFTGSGSSDQPLGILNTPGLQTKTFASALPSYNDVVFMIGQLAAADGDLAQSRFFMHPTTMTTLLRTLIANGSGETAVVAEGGTYRLGGIEIHSSTAVTENKIVLADMSAVTLLNYGPPQLIVDAFSNGKSTTGQTELIVQNYVDSMIRDRNLVVVGST